MTASNDNTEVFAAFPELGKSMAEAKVRSVLAEAAKAEAEAATELIEQDIKRAELDKIRTETAKTTAEQAKLELEAKHGLLLIEEQEINMDLLRRSHKEEGAKDYWHHRYIFSSSVKEDSANALINALTKWSRTSPADKPCDMEIVINSPGGDIISGFAIVDFIKSLRDSGHNIRTHAIGMAASMGGVLLQAGTTRSMGANAMLLIHQGGLGAIGNYGEVKDRVKLMEIFHERILDLFVERSEGKVSRSYLKKNWERQDWWLPAKEALKLGLVDEIR